MRSRNGGACKGTKAVGDYIEDIHRTRARLMPVLALMSNAREFNPRFGTVLTNGELGDIGVFLRDELGKVFKAVDSIGEVYRRNFG